MDNNRIQIEHNRGGYEITVHTPQGLVKTAWKLTFQQAHEAARFLADFYTDDNGQHLAIEIPADIVLQTY